MIDARTKAIADLTATIDTVLLTFLEADGVLAQRDVAALKLNLEQLFRALGKLEHLFSALGKPKDEAK